MKQLKTYQVTARIVMTRKIKANSKREAIEAWYEQDADQDSKITAKLIKGGK